MTRFKQIQKQLNIGRSIINTERGFILMTSLMMLVILMIIGIAATNTTTIELQVSGNDKVATQTFYQADGGAQVGIGLVESNIEDIGFKSNTQGGVHVNTLDLYLNDNTPMDWANPDAYLPNNAVGNDPRTDISVRSISGAQAGSGLQMVAGYEGVGKAAGSGGGVIFYDIGSRHSGPVNSESTVVLEWNHVIK